ncbi:MAG: glycosyltransferase family 2 protein [Candidatus Cryptobacteroides sp.]
MPKQPEISILVPCCNVEKYVGECLDSILSQTLKDIEIICLDDGSKDGTAEILNKYASEDPRIKVISKPNTGYGDTMNIGLEKASGKYIGIIESDDWIEKDMFERLYNEAVKYNLDCSRCLFEQFNEITGARRVVTGTTVRRAGMDKVFNPAENPAIFFIPPSIWAGLYKSSFLKDNGIRFLPTPGASYQDTSFAFKVYSMAKRVKVITKPLHHYRINTNSSVSSPGKIFCVCDEMQEIVRFTKEKGVYERLKGIIAYKWYGTYKWNYKRLPDMALKRQFINRWSCEAKDMFRDGAITRERFSPGRRLRLWFIANHPSVFRYKKRF